MTSLEDTQEKAYTFLQDTVKQLLTLSTGIVTLTVTFFKEFTGGPTQLATNVLPVSWISFGCSILAGLVSLSVLSGNLGRGLTQIYTANIRITFGLQQLLFVAGFALTIWAGADALGTPASTAPPIAP